MSFELSTGRGMERVTSFSYPGYFEPNELGGHNVWFPGLPERHTDGYGLDDAVNMAAEAPASGRPHPASA